MITEFKLPDVGEGIIEGDIIIWKVAAGETITEDQIVAEVETDKAIVEIPSPRAGVVITLHHQEGDVITVGDILVRKSISKNMPHQQNTTANVTHMDEAEVTALVDLKKKEEPVLKKKGIKFTYLPFIVKAVVSALKANTSLNATLNEETGEMLLKKYYNIGISVNTKDGLMVPVIKNADQKNIIKLAEEIEDLAEAARSRRIDLKKLKGGTFTITNIGSYGGIFSTPVINFPEAVILATGRIREKPMVKNGTIVIEKLLPLSLTFDHRIMDGAAVANFTRDLKMHLENPGLLLLELR